MKTYGGSYGGDDYSSYGQGQGHSDNSYQDSGPSYGEKSYGGDDYGGDDYGDKSYQDANSGFNEKCKTPWTCCKARRSQHWNVKEICHGCGNDVCNANNPDHWSRVQTAKPTQKPTIASHELNGGNNWGSAGECCQTIEGCPNSYPMKVDAIFLDGESMDQRIKLTVCCKQSQDKWGGDTWIDKWGGDMYEPTASPTLLPTLSPSSGPQSRRLTEERELYYGGRATNGEGNPYNNGGGYYGPYQENPYSQPYGGGGRSYGGGGSSYGGGGSSYGGGNSNKSYQNPNKSYQNPNKSYQNSYGGVQGYSDNTYQGYQEDDYQDDDDDYGEGRDNGYQKSKSELTILDRCPSQYEPTLSPTLSPTQYEPTLSPTQYEPTLSPTLSFPTLSPAL